MSLEIVAADVALGEAVLPDDAPDGGAPGGGPGGGAERSLLSPPRLLMNDAKSEDRVDELPLVDADEAAVDVASDVAVVSVLVAAPVVPPDCKLTRKDCSSAIN